MKPDSFEEFFAILAIAVIWGCFVAWILGIV